MRKGAVAGMADAQFAWVGLGRGDEVGNRLNLGMFANRDRVGKSDRLDDGLVIVWRIVGEVKAVRSDDQRGGAA